jgi:hypothetical protein
MDAALIVKPATQVTFNIIDSFIANMTPFRYRSTRYWNAANSASCLSADPPIRLIASIEAVAQMISYSQFRRRYPVARSALHS